LPTVIELLTVIEKPANLQ